MEDFHQDKRSRKLLRICKFLQMLYQELQSYGKTSQWTQEKERLDMGGRIPKGIWRVEDKNYKSTSTCSTQKRKKIQSGDRHIRTCY